MSTVLLAAGLAERSISCSVVVLRSGGGHLEERLAEAGVPLVVLPGGPPWRRVRALRRLLRGERPDIVHTALFDSDVVGRLAAVGSPTRVVSSLVSMPRQAASGQLPGASRWKLHLVNALDRLTGRLMVDRYLAVTGGVARAFEQRYRIDPSRISVVERGRPDVGVDRSQDVVAGVRSTLGLSEGAHLVVAVGRHARPKGFVDLVRAFADVATEHPNAVLVIAGRDGDDTARIRAVIDADAALDGRVLLVGHRDDVPALLAAADLFVLSSHVEGAAGAVIEAMASGTPIVATRLDGLAGVLEHDRTAVLCEAQDVAGLATALRRVLSDPVLAERLAAAARVDFLERFTVERSVDATIALYRDVLGPR
jgi:glycosyltransferase involved in cell wall biosynthesis